MRVLPARRIRQLSLRRSAFADSSVAEPTDNAGKLEHRYCAMPKSERTADLDRAAHAVVNPFDEWRSAETR